MGSFDAGEMIRLKVEREGKEIEFEITLAESIPPLQPQRLGVVVREQSWTPQVTTQDGEIGSGVVIDAILPGSAADKKLKAAT